MRDGDPATLPSAFVVANRAGNPIDLHNSRARQWAKACKAAGVTGSSPYDLRHTYASARAAEGCVLSYVGGQMGHSASHMTDRYTRVFSQAEMKERMPSADAILAARLAAAEPDVGAQLDEGVA